MLIYSRIKRIVNFIFFCLFIKVKLTNYISFNIIQVDDCLRKINISNEIYFEFTPYYFTRCGNYDDIGDCDAKNFNVYGSDTMIIKNYPYEFKLAIEITFEDLDHHEGFMNMDVYFNEYLIKTSDRRFWKCINCGGINGTNRHEDYFWERERINFYSGERAGGCWEELYIFIFQIDNMEQIYDGGENGAFEVKHDFYAFPDNPIIEREVYRSEGDIELELINFIKEELIHVKTNDSLKMDINNYYFTAQYYCIEGRLKGFTLNDEKNFLNDGDEFKFTETFGLNYVLGQNERNRDNIEIKIRITPYNYCPEGYIVIFSTKYYSM